jgi:L-threonylcarbamoyladenylate synthase
MVTEPRSIRLEPRQPLDAAAAEAARVLDHRGLVIAPTETRYGLLARADSPGALERLYRAKGRPSHTPTAIFVRDLVALGDFGVVTEAARRLADAFLPGPLTLVLTSLARLPAPVVIGDRIGLRFSSDPFIHELVGRCLFPLTATSANVSGRPDAETATEAAGGLEGEIDLLVDGGPRQAPPSSVVDCTCSPVKLIREGAIPFERLRDVVGEVARG